MRSWLISTRSDGSRFPGTGGCLNRPRRSEAVSCSCTMTERSAATHRIAGLPTAGTTTRSRLPGGACGIAFGRGSESRARMHSHGSLPNRDRSPTRLACTVALAAASFGAPIEHPRVFAPAHGHHVSGRPEEVLLVAPSVPPATAPLASSIRVTREDAASCHQQPESLKLRFFLRRETRSLLCRIEIGLRRGRLAPLLSLPPRSVRRSRTLASLHRYRRSRACAERAALGEPQREETPPAE